MRESYKLGFYAVMVLSASFIHSPLGLFLIAALALILAYPKTIRVLLPTLRFPLLFTSITLLSYIGYEAYFGNNVLHHAVLIAMRVFAMSVWSFWLIECVDLLKALHFAPRLQLLFTLAYSNIILLKTTHLEATLAFKSRHIEPPTLPVQWRFYRALWGSLLEKALHNAKESAYAMRSRGVFDDLSS